MICPKCDKYSFYIRKSAGKNAYCNRCGFKSKFIQPAYTDYHKQKYSNTLVRTIHNDPLLKRIDNEIIWNNKKTLLEYGCGTGDYIEHFRTKVKKTIGMDINIDRAQIKFPKSTFLQINQKKLPVKFDSVDIVVAVNVIEHIHDFEYVLKEFKRVLKTDGQLFITTYDRNFPLHFLNNDETHIIEWNKQEFNTLIEKHFHIIKFFKYGTFFNYYPINKFLVHFLHPELCILAKK
ncbi:MAG: class I SAM-dependent methyltransferase [bacterium]|nr:class I SAM-dependent methyltransferase [bacterium]